MRKYGASKDRDVILRTGQDNKRLGHYIPMQTNLPTELGEVLRGLPANWQLASLRFWAMGWVAELHTGARRFELIADRGYIEIHELGDYELVDKHKHQIGPTLEQIDAATPGIISRVLCNAVP